MIKGFEKRMIIVKTEGSKLFDEAYFVLRRDILPHRCEKEDLAKEAERILSESAPGTRAKSRRGGEWILFLSGILLGGGICLLLSRFFA